MIVLIKLEKINYKNEQRILIKFEYNLDLIKKVKTIPDR